MNWILKYVLWFLEGCVVGFGAILPGASGGALCVAFGMYLPLVSLISNPKQNAKKHGKMLAVFALGVVFGFIGLSGVAAWLMHKDAELATCAFIGFIVGTFPELWKYAGEHGRNKNSYIGMVIGFLAVFSVLEFLKVTTKVQLEQNFLNFVFSGALWGLSFIVPGLGASTLLLFFGLYEPILDGIAHFDMAILVPFLIGNILCAVLLAKLINAAYKRYHSVLSHTIIGIVAATAVMILPDFSVGGIRIFYQILCIGAGALVSYFLTVLCDRIKK